MDADDLKAATMLVLAMLTLGVFLCIIGNARGYHAAECAQACAGHDEYRLVAGECTCVDRSEVTHRER